MGPMNLEFLVGVTVVDADTVRPNYSNLLHSSRVTHAHPSKRIRPSPHGDNSKNEEDAFDIEFQRHNSSAQRMCGTISRNDQTEANGQGKLMPRRKILPRICPFLLEEIYSIVGKTI
jgi:hypothetical protein